MEKQFILKELQRRLERLLELQQKWERINRYDKYLEGRIEELAMIIDQIHHFETR